MEQLDPIAAWKFLAHVYFGCGISIGLLLLLLAPDGEINLCVWVKNVIFWPLLVRGKLLKCKQK